MTLKKKPVWKIVLNTAALCVLPVLSLSGYAMGGCPEACNNQTSVKACVRYGCHLDIDGKDTYHKCKWRKHPKKGGYHCVPSARISPNPDKSSDTAEAESK